VQYRKERDTQFARLADAHAGQDGINLLVVGEALSLEENFRSGENLFQRA
jgi:hypothetical protein